MTPAERFVPIEDAAPSGASGPARAELRQSGWWKRRIADGRCHYCARAVGARALTLDHVVPLIRGGRSVKGNVAPACKDCNIRSSRSCRGSGTRISFASPVPTPTRYAQAMGAEC